MAGEVGELLAGLGRVEGDDTGVACDGEVFVGGGEFDAADGFDEAGEGVYEAGGGVVEDVDAAVLVAGRGHFAVGADVDGEAEGALGLILGDLFRGAGVRERVGIVDVDAAVMGGGGKGAAILAQGDGPALACGFLVRFDLAFGFPGAFFRACPDFEFACEPCACCCPAVAAGCYVMATERMDLF